jgi:hypothetical protein
LRSSVPSLRTQAGSRDEAGFDKSLFLVDWEAKVVTCPAGKKSISWLPNTYPANGTPFEARFARLDGTPCSSRSQCTRSKQEPRILGLQTREHHEALQAKRVRQPTNEFRQTYAARAGIESTHAQVMKRSGLRRTRYRGLSDPFAARRHRSSHQLIENRILNRRIASCENQVFPLRRSSVPSGVNSPPVSMLCWVNPLE